MTKSLTPQIAGVIFTPVDLQRAIRMRNPPDLFELRLDALFAIREELEATLKNLRAPLIITARHPREGGSSQLSLQNRRLLLLRFLPHAAYVDIELRSADALAPILEAARAKRIPIIISFHDFNETPSRLRLDAIARAARSMGADVLKIATRTDTQEQLSRLLRFFAETSSQLPIAAMGIGRLGRTARRELTKRGSPLNYAHLGHARIPGQPSLSDVRRWALARESV
jgi:3-dehydroquinate dehydratase I